MRLQTTPSHRASEPRRVLIRPLLPQSHNPSFYSQNPRLFRQANEFSLSPHPAPFSNYAPTTSLLSFSPHDAIPLSATPPPTPSTSSRDSRDTSKNFCSVPKCLARSIAVCSPTLRIPSARINFT